MGKPKEQHRVLRALCKMCREGQHRFTTSLEGTQTGWELGISPGIALWMARNLQVPHGSVSATRSSPGLPRRCVSLWAAI